MTDSGNWFALHRKITDSAVFADADLLQLWIWILSKASFRTVYLPMTVGRGETIVELSPGELVVGRKTGASALGWKPSTFRDRLNRLKKLGMVAINPDSHWSVVRVVNWGHYQPSGPCSPTPKRKKGRQANSKHEPSELREESDAVDVTDDNQPTGKRQANDNQPTQDKNADNAKNAKKTHDDAPSLQDVVDYWNQQTGQSCRVTDKRKTALAQRRKDPWWREHWKQAIDAAAASDFYMGKNDRGWTAGPDWFLKADSATKLVELKQQPHKNEQQQETRGQALPLRRPASRSSREGSHA